MKNPKNTLFRSFVSLFISTSFFLTSIISPINLHAQTVLDLPVVGSFVNVSDAYLPPVIKGLTIDVNNPLAFDFIIDTGDAFLEGDALNRESNRLIKYFLAALTVPEEELWVNLSPYESDAIIPDGFGQTEMGRDLLAQDYILKQLTASLVHPGYDVGQEFWDRVRAKTRELYGHANIPVNAFSKVWIVPDRAVVYEHQNTAFIADVHLKVMLQEDYVALQENLGVQEYGLNSLPKDQATEINEEASAIIAEVLLPEIEREVNEGKNFGKLRQIYHAVILSTWYKLNLKQALLNQVYSNQNKVSGIQIRDPQINQKIYDQYVKAFEKGVLQLVQEDYQAPEKDVIPRKYFAGGADMAMIPQLVNSQKITGDFAQLSIQQQSMLSQSLPASDHISSTGVSVPRVFEISSRVREVRDVNSPQTFDSAMFAKAALTGRKKLVYSFAKFLGKNLMSPQTVPTGNFTLADLHASYGTLVGQDGVNVVIDWLGADPQAKIVYLDSNKISDKNMHTHRLAVDIEVALTVALANRYIQDQWPGLAEMIVLQGDEKALIISSEVSQEESQVMLREMQSIFQSAIVGDFGFVKVAPQGLNQGTWDQVVPIANKALGRNDVLSGLYEDEDGFFVVYNRRKLALDESAQKAVEDFNRQLKDNNVPVSFDIDGTAVRVFSPEVKIGVADISLLDDLEPQELEYLKANPHALFGRLISIAENMADFANDYKRLAGLGELTNIRSADQDIVTAFEQERPRLFSGQKSTLPALKFEEKIALMADMNPVFKDMTPVQYEAYRQGHPESTVFMSDLDPVMPAVKRDVMGRVISKNFRDDKDIFVMMVGIRYVPIAGGSTAKGKEQIISEIMTKQNVSRAQAIDVFKQEYRSAENGREPFKPVNRIKGHIAADKLIKQEAEAHNEVLEKYEIREGTYLFWQGPDNFFVVGENKGLSPADYKALVDDVKDVIAQKSTFKGDLDLEIFARVVESKSVASLDTLKKDPNLFFSVVDQFELLDFDFEKVVPTSVVGPGAVNNSIYIYNPADKKDLQSYVANKRSDQRPAAAQRQDVSFAQQIKVENIARENMETKRIRWFKSGDRFVSEFDPVKNLTIHTILDENGVVLYSVEEWGNTANDEIAAIVARSEVLEEYSLLKQGNPVKVEIFAKSQQEPTIFSVDQANNIIESNIFSGETDGQTEGFVRSVALLEMGQNSYDRAMLNNVGGINLNPAMLTLEIKRDPSGAPLPFSAQPQDLNMKIDGFLPVIIDITPINSLPLLLGINAADMQGFDVSLLTTAIR